MSTFINKKIEISHRNLFKEKINRNLSLTLFLLSKSRKRKRAELKNEFPVRCYKNVCFMSGEQQSVNSKFSLARIQLRKYVAFGYFPMVTPSSW
jgi:ribosomal protein S14